MHLFEERYYLVCVKRWLFSDCDLQYLILNLSISFCTSSACKHIAKHGLYICMKMSAIWGQREFTFGSSFGLCLRRTCLMRKAMTLYLGLPCKWCCSVCRWRHEKQLLKLSPVKIPSKPHLASRNSFVWIKKTSLII